MNPIANGKIKEVIDYLHVDLEYPAVDTSSSRQQQQKGLEVFRDTMNMLTVKDMQDLEYIKVYQNSFSRCRSRYDEHSRVSLASEKRK